jgi:hypothetical protein
MTTIHSIQLPNYYTPPLPLTPQYMNVKMTEYFDKIRLQCNCGHRYVTFRIIDSDVPKQNSSVLKMETNLATTTTSFSAVTEGKGK